MSYHNDLRNFAFRKGYWLADAWNYIADSYFDILDPESYPFQLNDNDLYEIKNIIKKIRISEITIEGIDMHYELHRARVSKLLNEIRNIAMKNLDAKVTPEIHKKAIHHKEMVPQHKLEKRIFFLYVAKQVVSGAESVASAARKFKVSRVNVAIWVAILLDHGEDVFLHADPFFNPDIERTLVSIYLYEDKSIPSICSRFLIFNRKHLRHMIKRYYKMFPNSKALGVSFRRPCV